MKNKIALAFAGLMLMTIVFFAPTANATWHGLPDVQKDTYIAVNGEMNGKVQLHLGPLAPAPLNVPFVTRDPWITPMTILQNISFSMVHPQLPVVFLTVPWQTIQSLQHVFWSDTLGYTMVTLLPIPGSDGMGWLYLAPGIADVDIYTFNTYMQNPSPPPYNVTNPPEIPIAMWTGPSPLAGSPAAVPGMTYYPFPDPGVDNLPGCLALGQDDGFGDGIPDPAGSSVLFLPLQMAVHAWNGTAWVFTFGGPFVMPLTTGTAFDTVVAPGLDLNGETITYTGSPWENLASTGQWGANENKKTVTYACAWSFIQYYLSDGPPVVKLDLIYGMRETKVKMPHQIPDINADGKVDVFDLRIAAKAFGLRDEGLGRANADPGFDARADLDNNGIIDIFDLRRIAKSYGAELDP